MKNSLETEFQESTETTRYEMEDLRSELRAMRADQRAAKEDLERNGKKMDEILKYVYDPKLDQKLHRERLHASPEIRRGRPD